jgi:ribonuclease III
MSQEALMPLQEKLGYEFSDPTYLQEAVRHSSYVNEWPGEDLRDNERLEFLGDAVINLVVGHVLMTRYPFMKEGELSRMRASLVNEQELADFARALNLGDYLLLGKGESQANGQDKPSILADALEALAAAVYLDGGYTAAFEVLAAHFSTRLKDMPSPTAALDYKSRLQELVQLKMRITPQYQLIDEIGPDHDKTFRSRITIGELSAEGTGKSKKAAEQEAACNALAILDPS